MASLVKEKEVSLRTESESADLAPILQDAVTAMKCVKAADITELKRFSNPPVMITLIMEAVCILNSIEPKMMAGPTGRKVPNYWHTAKIFLGSPNFLKTLIEFDPNNVPEAIMTKIRKEYISNPKFSPEIAKKSSMACAGLCRWVIAMEKYDRAVRTMAPKKTALIEAKKD